MAASKKVVGVPHASILARKMRDPAFRIEYEQRRLVHEVALAIRAMRKQAGKTQVQLAKMIGVSQPMIAKLEKGIDQRTPRFEILGKISVMLGKQMRLSFMNAEEDGGHLVEVDGRPAADVLRGEENAPA